MYISIHRRTFDFNKRILKKLRTNAEFYLFIQKIVNSMSKMLRLVVLSYSTSKLST